MPPPVYSRRLYGPALLTAPVGVGPRMTVPAGRVYVVKQILLLNTSLTVDAVVRVGIGTDYNAGALILAPVLKNTSVLIDVGMLPLTAGEVVWAYPTGNNVTTMTLTGYDFEA